MRLKALRTMSVLFVLTGCMISGSFAQTGDTGTLAALPKQFAATAVGQAGASAGKSLDLTIYITGWTTDEQTKSYIDTLKTKKQDGVVSEMEKTEDVGRLAPTGGVGTGVRFARYSPGKDGGIHIVLATNRPMSFPELYNSGRSTDYPFTIVTMDIGKDGKGSGTLAALCKIKFNKQGELEIENFGIQPARLTNIYVQK